MYKVTILPLAKQDIKEVSFWYNSKQQGLGKRFTKEVREKVSYIRQFPEAFAIRYDEVRCAVLDLFPVMIHYMIDAENNILIISAVFHTSLNPQKWQKR